MVLKLFFKQNALVKILNSVDLEDHRLLKNTCGSFPGHYFAVSTVVIAFDTFTSTKQFIIES